MLARTSTKVDIQIEIFESIDEISEIWDDFMTDHVFMSSAYLRSIERCPPSGLVPFYVLFQEKGKLIGKAYFQKKTFKASESIKAAPKKNCPSFFGSLGHYMRDFTSKRVEFESLACGHIMLSGNYAFRFLPEYGSNFVHQSIDLAIDKLTKNLQDKGKEISIILLKDFPTQDRFSERTGLGPKYFEFTIQPNMVLDIRDHWKSEEDYLGDMTSKYRVRYRRSRKKFEGLTMKEMSLEQVEQMREEMYDLYFGIANSSGFNLFHLNPDYLPELKASLGDKLTVTGYFDGQTLVGFTTFVTSDDHGEAHFIGFKEELNRSHQLYQNMLYDMVLFGIENGVKRIDFARTAMEIKSTVGAEPETLYCYMRHQKAVHNTFVPKLFQLLNPEEEWVQRHPFKTS
jgi:predicted N-acyltransferase